MTIRDRRNGRPAKGLKTSAHARKICIAFDDKMFDQISLHQREAGLGSFGEAVRALMSYAFDRLAADDLLDAANEANRREFEALFRQPATPDRPPGHTTTPIGHIKAGATYQGITAVINEDGGTTYTIHTTPALPDAPERSPPHGAIPIGAIKTGDTFHGCEVCTIPGLEPDSRVFVCILGPVEPPAKRPPPTSTPQPETPPHTGGEARSLGITDDAPDDAGAKTRDS